MQTTWPKSGGPRWLAVATHPQAERLATQEMSLAGYRSYLPYIAVRQRDPVVWSMWRKSLVPRFAGYCFVQHDYDADPWQPIHRLAGVRNILTTPEGRPVPVDDKLIAWLMALDAEKPLLDAAKMPIFAVGQVVRIEDGPFQGFPATVLACDGYTTELLVTIFGRSTKVTIERYRIAGAA